MNQLIKITEDDGRQVVSARELYEALGFHAAHWAKWYKKNIIDNPFASENVDWQGFTLSVSGNETMDFALSIDFAKKLSMTAKTKEGENVRNYFIEVEKVAKNVHHAIQQNMEPEEILLKALQLQIEQKKRITAVENDVRQLKAQSKTRPDWFTIVGYATIRNMHIGLSMAGSLGKKAKKICSDRGITLETIPDPRFGRVNMYPENVLYEVFNQPIM